MVGCNQNINNMHNSFTNILKKTSGNFCINIFVMCNVVSKMDVFFDVNTLAKKHSA